MIILKKTSSQAGKIPLKQPNAKGILFQGAHRSVSEIAKLVGMHNSTLYYRLYGKGMSLEEAISTPRLPTGKRTARLYQFQGKLVTIQQAAEMKGLSYSSMWRRTSADRILDGDELHPQKSWEDLPSNAVLITYEGKTDCLAGWAKKHRLKPQTLAHRLKAGWPMKYALTLPTHVGGHNTITYKNQTRSIGDWAKAKGISYHALRARLEKYNWDAHKALTTPVNHTKSYTYTFKGKTLTLPQWSVEVGILESTLRERLFAQHWTLERALTEPSMTASERAQRRATLKRMITGFQTPTGGSLQTFSKSLGTGAGTTFGHLASKMGQNQ